LQRHLRTLGILWIIVGVLWVIPSLVLLGFSHAPHFMMGDDMFTHAFMPPMMFSMGIVFLAIAAGGILVGWGLMNHERWARMTAIVIGILVLLHPPFGTALGIYTLWVLLPAESAAEYDRMSHA
jgi:dolichyl-phosphate-mannose--protein O-mannosyl transferase